MTEALHRYSGEEHVVHLLRRRDVTGRSDETGTHGYDLKQQKHILSRLVERANPSNVHANVRESYRPHAQVPLRE